MLIEIAQAPNERIGFRPADRLQMIQAGVVGVGGADGAVGEPYPQQQNGD